MGDFPASADLKSKVGSPPNTADANSSVDNSKKRSSAQNLNEVVLVDTPGEARAAKLLKLLSRDSTLTDATIVVSGTEIPIHRTVVAPISPFFASALCGPFSEAQKKKLVLRDASAAAVSVIVDYAYAKDFEESLEAFKVALDVWKLAHRYQVDALCARAARYVLANTPVEQLVPVLQHARLYGEEQDADVATDALAANFAEVAKSSPDFEKLTFDELNGALRSRQLIVTEYEKFQAVAQWAKANPSKDSAEHNDHCVQIFGHVHFRLLRKDELLQLLSDPTVMPMKAYQVALEQSLYKSAKISGLQCCFPGSWRRHLWTEDDAEFVISATRSTQESPKDGEEPLYFTFHNWRMAAILNWKPEVCFLTLDLDFQDRLSTDGEYSALRLQDDILKYTFWASLKLIQHGMNERDKEIRLDYLDDYGFEIDLVRELSADIAQYRNMPQLGVLVHLNRQKNNLA